MAANRAQAANTSKVISTTGHIVPPLKLEDLASIIDKGTASPAKQLNCFQNNSPYYHHQDKEEKPRPKPLMREVPDEFENEHGNQQDAMKARANEMKEQMQRRSVLMKTEWEKGSRKLQAWLVSNNFVGGVNMKKS